MEADMEKNKVMGKGKAFLSWVGTIVRRFASDDVGASAAHLTYYMVLAFFPFIIFLLNLISYVNLDFGALSNTLSQVIPQDTLAVVEGVVKETVQAKSPTVLSGSVFLALWSMTRAMNGVRKGLNKAYQVEEKRPLWQNLLLSLFFTLGLIVVVLLALSLLVFGKLIGNAVSEFFGLSASIMASFTTLRYLVPPAIMFLIFLFFYRFMPNRKISFSDVWLGALFSTVGWIGGSALFSFYVNHFGNYSRVYGSLGGIIVFLVWLYLSSIIILIGGQINATLHLLKKDA